jgi:hypothetical protein
MLKSVKIMGDAEIQDQALGFISNEQGMVTTLKEFSIICQQGSRLDTYAQTNAFAVTHEGEPIVVTTTAPPLTVPNAPKTTVAEKVDSEKNATVVVIIVCSILFAAIVVAAILGFKKKNLTLEEIVYDEIEDESGYVEDNGEEIVEEVNEETVEEENK